MYNPKNNEEIFEVKPVGVRYICEFCNKGEMKFNPNTENNGQMKHMKLYPHKCTECGGIMQLKEIYPKIEWQEVKK